MKQFKIFGIAGDHFSHVFYMNKLNSGVSTMHLCIYNSFIHSHSVLFLHQVTAGAPYILGSVSLFLIVISVEFGRIAK